MIPIATNPTTLDDPMLEDPTPLGPVLPCARLPEVSPEWVQQEFEAIIAAEWPQPRRYRWTPPVTAPSRPTPSGDGPARAPHRGDRAPLTTTGPAWQASPRQRSPPPLPSPARDHPPI
jgi:hypothetical protein